MLFGRRSVTIAQALWLLGVLAVAIHVLYTILGIGPATEVGTWLPSVVFAFFAAAVLVRACADPRDRGAWLALGGGLCFYLAGQLSVTLNRLSGSITMSATLRDFISATFYPCVLVAIGLLVTGQRSQARRDLWLDGVIGGLTTGALGVVIAFDSISGAEPYTGAAGNVIYILGDLLVLGFAIGACALLGWRPSRTLLALIGGFVILAVDDALYLAATITGKFVPGDPLDVLWLVAFTAITAVAVWSPPLDTVDRVASPATVVAFPFVFALTAVALSAHESMSGERNELAVALISGALVAVVVRFALTFRAHLALIDATKRDALTDELTGLGNRRKLMLDAERSFANARAEDPILFAIFDLDGLKAHNDTFGHPEGDALLARMGTSLGNAIATQGSAYRIGGDEFCVLIPGEEHQRSELFAAARHALTERTPAYAVENCHGRVLVPVDAHDLQSAMRLADTKLYAAKKARSVGDHRTAR